MAATADRALVGRRVLLTRPAGRGGRLARLLEALGAQVESRPTIRLEPPADPQGPRRAIRSADSYDWLLFTSANGVRFFFALWRELRSEPSPRAGIGAIGPATAAELIGEGVEPDLVARASHSEGLAAALQGRVQPRQRVLVVRPEVGRPVLVDSLIALGAQTEAVAFYRNVPAPGVVEVARDIGRGRFDVVVFTSPSTLQHLLRAAEDTEGLLREGLGHATLVAIGQVTARALEAAQLSVGAVATEPSDQGIADAVRSLFSG